MVLSASANWSLTYNVTFYICPLHRWRLCSFSSSLHNMHNLPFFLLAAIGPAHLPTSPPQHLVLFGLSKCRRYISTTSMPVSHPSGNERF